LGDERGMQFALVFMEACKGTLPNDPQKRPPLNIERLYMTGHGSAEYRGIDYAALLTPQTQPMPLSKTLDTALAPKYFALARGEEPSWTSSRLLRLAIWWIPAFGFLAVWIIHRLRKQRHQQAD
jgi:hypothetical protein